MNAEPLSPICREVLRKLLGCLRERVSGNYDARRFSLDGVDRSEVFDLAHQHENLCFFIAHQDEFQQVASLLQDTVSRDLLIELILWRLAGHLHVKLSTNTERYWKVQEQAYAFPGHPSRLAFQGIFGPLKHYEGVPFLGRELTADCWPISLASVFLMKQYFFERENVRICPEPGDHVIDAGSLFGDTALAFATAIGERGRVYSFDPLASHSEITVHNIVQNGLEGRIRFFPVALGSFDNEIEGPVMSGLEANPGYSLETVDKERLPIRTIDTFLSAGTVPRVDFLKMDVEGSELEALRGAEGTLRRYKPKLAISVYHKFSDLFEIPFFIEKLGLGYRFYLDHYTIHAEETVLYAAVG